MKPKTRKTLLILVGIPLLVLGGWIAWLFEGGRVAVALAKHRVRASGLPTTIEEIRPPQVRNEDNAAPVIARFDSLIRPALSPTFKSEGSSPSNLTSMISLMRDDQRSVRNFSFRRDPSFPQAEAAWLVDARKRARTRGEWVSAQLDSPPALAALAVIREAAAKSGYDAQVDYQPGSLPRWPDDGKQLWNGATLLAGHAWLAVERGHTEEACTDAWAMLRLADFFANEPALFRQEIQLSIWRMAVECIEDLV